MSSMKFLFLSFAVTLSVSQNIDKNIILLNEKFEIFDKFLEGHEYILNNKFGMSDIIMGAASYRYLSLPIERPNLLNLKSWYDKISNRDCFKKNILGTFG